MYYGIYTDSETHSLECQKTYGIGYFCDSGVGIKQLSLSGCLFI